MTERREPHRDADGTEPRARTSTVPAEMTPPPPDAGAGLPLDRDATRPPDPLGASTGGASGARDSRLSGSSAEFFVPFRLLGKPRPGQVLFGRYRVEKELGQGGMGSVWLVHHLEHRDDRALKLIVSEIAGDPQVRARFKREARVMYRLVHPNAVKIHHAMLGDDVAFIEMEYVRGEGLNARLRGGPRPVEWAGHVLGQLCDVLHAAHDLGIVHRDLKPSNLMLVEGPHPGRDLLKVLDFGIAKILSRDGEEADDVKTQTNIFLGTPHYSSPEQIRGAAIDARSDLYSVGVILYEMLAGRRPFGGSAQALIRGHMTDPPPPFAEKCPGLAIPPAVERAVLRCLAKDPDDRPQSAQEVIESFLDALAAPAPKVVAVPEPADRPPETTTAQAAFAAPLPRAPEPARPAEPTRVASPPPPAAMPPGGRGPSRLARLAFVVASLAALAALVWFASRDNRPSPKPVPNPKTPGTPSAARAYDLGIDARRQLARWKQDGYEPIVEEGTDSGWPTSLGRVDKSTGIVLRYRLGPTGHYLPAGYRAEGEALAGDGWPVRIVREGDRVPFLRIEGGRFRMGALDEASGVADDASRPAHEVLVSGFYIQRDEVSNAEMDRHVRSLGEGRRPRGWEERYRRWSRSDPGAEVAGVHPAMAISHGHAEAFAATYAGGMLPTEGQWEFAARSRSADKNPFVWSWNPAVPRSQPEGVRLGGLGHINALGDGPMPTKPGGSFATTDVTEQGVRDLAGNVREWCRDVFAPYVKAEPPPKDPCNRKRVGQGDAFVVRGGAYSSLDARSVRTTARDKASGTEEQSDIGFRVVLETPESPGPRR